MNILHLDSSILGANSASRTLSAAIVARLAKAQGAGIVYRDLAADPLPHLTGEHVAARLGAVPESPALQDDIAVSQAVLDEFLAADTVVIGAPFYNFGVPSQLKAWIDRIAVAGKTFRYTANGPEGLAGGKRVILAVSRGGFYGAGSPAAGLEHGESHLKAVFALLGIKDVEVVAAEGLAIGPAEREKAMSAALAAVSHISPQPQLRAA